MRNLSVAFALSRTIVLLSLMIYGCWFCFRPQQLHSVHGAFARWICNDDVQWRLPGQVLVLQRIRLIGCCSWKRDQQLVKTSHRDQIWKTSWQMVSYTRVTTKQLFSWIFLPHSYFGIKFERPYCYVAILIPSLQSHIYNNQFLKKAHA